MVSRVCCELKRRLPEDRSTWAKCVVRKLHHLLTSCAQAGLIVNHLSFNWMHLAWSLVPLNGLPSVPATLADTLLEVLGLAAGLLETNHAPSQSRPVFILAHSSQYSVLCMLDHCVCWATLLATLCSTGCRLII